MALSEYKKKRAVTHTPEPFGGKPLKDKLEFVVQKHAASHLHYDFRLEVKGMLKSWAVPKGPSLDPAIKHLAMLVEDHPFDYKDFEGIIPKGQYGGGTVIVWDHGTYEPLEPASSKAAQEKIMMKEFYAGSIKIRMHGKKLKGEFALVRTKGRGENSWLLIKHRDEFATTADITLKDKSVISRKTLAQMAKDKKAVQWISNHNRSEHAQETSSGVDKPKKQAAAKATDPKKSNTASALKQPAKPKAVKNPGKKMVMPAQVNPMLCTLTKVPLDDADYLYEIKWDGYRIISYCAKGKIRMDSRSGIDYTKRYPLVAEALKNLSHDVVIDGEMVVFNDDGLPDFDALQLYNGHRGPIAYCVFDLLWMDGYSLMDLPLTARKTLLQEVVEGHSVLSYSDSFEGGKSLYEQAVKRNLEGIIAKKKNSTYHPGERGNDWLKTPTRKRQEFVIGGWAESDKSRSFRSLVFGAYHHGKLEWIGRSGGGYKDKDMPGILTQLKKLEIPESPFTNKVLDTKGAGMHWVKPTLVANFEFATWTKAGRIRKPATFLGFRKDKKAAEVVREIPKSIKKIEKETPPVKKAKTAKKKNA